MRIRLERLDRTQLAALAQARVPAGLAERAEPGALPPPVVARRALDRLAAGIAAHWCGTFLIVDATDARILGGCGFKGDPVDGQVEILYGVAPARRGQGIATAAVKALLALALEQGASDVLAEMVPGNLPSIRTVERCGFVPAGRRVASDGAEVVQWRVSLMPPSA